MKIKSGYIKVFIAAVIWGTIGAFARWSGLSPLELSFFRLLIAGFTLYFILPREERLFIFYTKDYMLITLAGILFAVDTLLYFNALRLTTLSNAVLPYNLQPVFMALLTPLFLRERIEPRYAFSFLLALSGVGILLLPSLTALSYNDAAGIGFSVAGALCLSLIALIARYLNIQAITFVYYKLFIAALCLLPFIRISSSLTIYSLIIVCVIALIHTALAYILYYDGLKTTQIEHVVALTFFIPIIAALTGFFLFQETITLYTLVGGLFIIINGIIVIYKS